MLVQRERIKVIFPLAVFFARFKYKTATKNIYQFFYREKKNYSKLIA